MLTFRAMVVELTCEKLQIENKTSDIQLPEHIKAWKTAKKMEWFDHFVEPVVDTIMNIYKAPDKGCGVTCPVQGWIIHNKSTLFFQREAYRCKHKW